MTNEESEKRILEKAYQRLETLFGKNVDQAIIDRLNEEVDWYKENLGLAWVENVINILEEKKKQGHLVVPRLWTTSSFLLYLLGGNSVNPLPAHHKCPHHHFFAWGKNHGGVCPECGEPLIEDGFGLDFIFFKDALGQHKLNLNYLGEIEEKDDGMRIAFFPGPKAKGLLEEASRLGITQEEIETDLNPKAFDKIVAFIQSGKRNTKIKPSLFPILMQTKFRKLAQISNAHDMDLLSELAAAIYGAGVIDAGKLLSSTGELPLGYAFSRESLYRLLKEKGLGEEEAFSAIKDLYRINGGGLSGENEAKLRTLNVEEEFILALKRIRYLFFKGNQVAEIRLEMRVMEKLLPKVKS